MYVTMYVSLYVYADYAQSIPCTKLDQTSNVWVQEMVLGQKNLECMGEGNSRVILRFQFQLLRVFGLFELKFCTFGGHNQTEAKS